MKRNITLITVLIIILACLTCLYFCFLADSQIRAKEARVVEDIYFKEFKLSNIDEICIDSSKYEEVVAYFKNTSSFKESFNLKNMNEQDELMFNVSKKFKLKDYASFRYNGKHFLGKKSKSEDLTDNIIDISISKVELPNEETQIFDNNSLRQYAPLYRYDRIKRESDIDLLDKIFAFIEKLMKSEAVYQKSDSTKNNSYAAAYTLIDVYEYNDSIFYIGIQCDDVIITMHIELGKEVTHENLNEINEYLFALGEKIKSAQRNKHEEAK